MSQATRNLDDAYRETLRRYLAEDNEDSLLAAYELGRRGLDMGLGPLDMAMAHQRALESLIQSPATTGATMGRALRMSGHFLTESLSAFEMFHRAGRETRMALRRMNEIMEKEAKRIAHSLHDQAGQLLATVHLELHELARATSSDGLERISRISEHIDALHDQLRTLSHELRPMVLDQLGLVSALHYLAKGVTSRTGLAVQVEGELTERLDELCEIAIYRGAQEALNNAAKYSRADQVWVLAQETEDGVVCTIRDDGVGFEPDQDAGDGTEGIGLVCVRERLRGLDGEVDVQSAPGQGTEVCLRVPIFRRND